MTGLRVVTGATLGRQAVVMGLDERPDPQRFAPVQSSSPWVKPQGGGLWTSTYTGPDTVSDWVEWCRGETWGDHDLAERSVWLLDPRPEARLVEVHDYADLAAILERYPNRYVYGGGLPDRVFPDFEAISRDFDGMHLTQEGQWRTRLSHPHDLYGWDCESTIWFAWSFVDQAVAA